MATSCDLGAQAVIAFDIGLGLAVQGQRLWGIQWRPADHLAIDQPVQQVQDMGLGRHALGQCQLHGGQHGLFVMLQNEGKDIDHLTIAARLAQHMVLQLSEGRRQFQKWCAVAKRSRLSLNDRQVMPPIIDRARQKLMIALDDAGMFAQDVALGCHHQPVRIDPQADRAVRK